MKIVTVLAITAIVAGCASPPEKIAPTYISPMAYNTRDCRNLQAELQRVQSRVTEVARAQKKKATQDAVATGVGLVVFWPALFFLVSDDRAEELARLKGEHEALTQAMIAQGCS